MTVINLAKVGPRQNPRLDSVPRIVINYAIILFYKPKRHKVARKQDLCGGQGGNLETPGWRLR
ncbi:hypothetical protein BBB56_10315 [Candidatus Pantoea deserta]|uniref:Uncharacterized protein n=1 Tax=Candidatus Pantoea deserta TaxID=1869313 RepID=A0A3N4PNU3_9GAMM|nr:hypothetical protein BBB56_10315 [Pantoea deserta]